MTEEAILTKARIRTEARGTRLAISEEEKNASGAQIAHNVLHLPELEGVVDLLAYTANGEEVDPYPIVDALRVRGMTISMPRVDEPVGLSLHVVEDDSQLVYGAYGILEPDHEAPITPPERIDAALVPGIAFDSRGNRIG